MSTVTTQEQEYRILLGFLCRFSNLHHGLQRVLPLLLNPLGFHFIFLHLLLLDFDDGSFPNLSLFVLPWNICIDQIVHFNITAVGVNESLDREDVSHTEVYSELLPEAFFLFGQREKHDAISDFRQTFLFVYRLEQEGLEQKGRETDLGK